MAKKPSISTQERQWRAQDALSTLTRAAEIQKDKTLMADVRKAAKQQVQNLTAVVPPAKTPVKRSK